jgi:hypothetical protein
MIDIISAIIKIIFLWFQKNNVAETKREVLRNEVSKAIKEGDTRNLHRIMSRL